MSLSDTGPHRATINGASGATRDVGSEGVTLVEGLTTDSTGNLYALSGSGGAVIGTLPCPTPTVPAPVVAPAKVTAAPATEVLGLQSGKPADPSKPILPVTGADTMPMLALAAACLLLGAGALKLSKRQKAEEWHRTGRL